MMQAIRSRRTGIPGLWGIRLGLLPLLLGAFLSAAAAGGEIVCAGCHEVKVTSPQHQDMDCESCHSNIEKIPHQESPLEELGGSEICAQCHDSEMERVGESAHGGILECTNCHGDPHQLIPPSDLNSSMAPLKQIRICGACHDDDSKTSPVDGYLRSVHGHALVVSGLINAPSCSDCHGSHDILPPGETDSQVSHERVPKTCGQCHQYLLQTWRSSSHGRTWARGSEGPVCTTCHNSHDIEPPRGRGPRLKSPENCGTCHEDRLKTYRDNFHGQVTSLGFVTAATCSDCHSPHHKLPASDPQSTVNAANLSATCGQCHNHPSASFLSFDPHMDPSVASKAGPVHLVWLVMTILMIGVFGFFGLHDLLWLQRSVVGVWRGEFASSRPSNGEYVRRFSRRQIFLHATVVTSFLLLAATGLPLKFHFTHWSSAMTSLLGGISRARVLHRLGAIVTFLYAGYHIFDVARTVLVKKDFGVLWGRRSIVPRWKDLQDLAGNIRYFLYLGPRPPVDRWSYWEKFDYFAVFWGVAIIGASGLVLWFPRFFTLFAPGWLLNAAFVVHSDEALLAVGFIFVFHFYHTHLRPEVFPIDVSVFTGRVGLDRFREERPAEYARLVKEGRLQQCLLPAPTRRRLKIAYAFGFTALGLGTLLIAGIFLALLLH